jgi:methyl-accepting chemotaxis protein
MNWTINTKLSAATLFLCALVMLAAGAGFYGASTLAGVLTFITGPAWEAADGAMEGTIGLQRQIVTTFHIVGSKTGADDKRMDSDMEKAHEFTEHAFTAMRGSKLIPQRDLDKLDDMLKSYADAEEKLLAAHAQRQKDVSAQADFDAAYAHFNTTSQEALEFLAELEEVGDSQVESKSDSINETRNLVYMTLAVITGIGIVLGAAVVMLVRNTIAKPIRDAAEQLRVISEVDGDLTVALPENNHDEIGHLAHYFNDFVGKLRKSIQAFDVTTGSVYQEAQRLQSIAGEHSHTARQQSHEIDQVAAAINEMTATIAEVASNASHAAQSARDADGEARTGATNIARMLSLIGQLQTESSNTTQVIQTLRDETESIGSVLGVIRNIAEQTNLLALNAAIEAARAGDQGRGFAVVADEVRTLATRTQQSTQDIQAMIERLQSGAQGAVQAMTSSGEITRDCVAQTTSIETSLRTMKDMISTISSMNIQISTATDQQNQAAQEINASICRISVGAEAVTSAMQQNATSSQSLAQSADQLKKITAQFKY